MNDPLRDALSACRVVLVGTHYPGNLGSVARAMRNFGLDDLVLVNPIAARDDPEAIRLATHGEAILREAKVVGDFVEAVSDCQTVLATSALADGHYRERQNGSPRTIFPDVVTALPRERIALVFGPEPSGLTNEEVSRCHRLIRIPSSPEYGALNLAQAVTVCLYELRIAAQERRFPEAAELPEVADFADQERMFEHLRQGLEAIHYLYDTKSDVLFHSIRNLLGRARPSPREVQWLHGIAKQMVWIAERKE